MKKFCLLLTIVFVFAAVLGCNVWADGPQAYMVFPTLYDESELDACAAAVQTGGMATVEEAVNPYKLYPISSTEFYAILENPQAGLEGLQDYVWLLPMADGSNRRVSKQGDAFVVLGGRLKSETPSQEDIDMIGAFEALAEAFPAEQLQPDRITVYALEVIDCFSSFLVCTTGEKTVVVPYSDAAHLTRLETGKLYDAEEAVNTLKQAFSADSTATGSENGGAAAVSEETRTVWPVVVIAGIVVAAAGTFAWIFRRRRRLSYQE